MADSADAQLTEAVGRGLESGQVAMHVHYRRARRVDGFREALVEQVGPQAVTIRDHFMKVALVLLLLWFAVAQMLRLHETTVLILGSPMTLGFLTFAGVLLALVLFYRSRIKPMQGRAMHLAALSDPDLFARLWQGGALALMTREGPDRICQSPCDDWRQYVRRTLMLQG